MGPLIIPTNQPINPTATPTVNDCLTSFKDHLSSSDYHSFSSNDPSDQKHRQGSCPFNPPLSSSDSSTASTTHDPMSSDHQASLNMARPQSDKVLLNNHAASSSVPFKWEEAPGKPIPTSTLEMGSHSDNLSNASPLQLPPKLHPQAHHSLLLQSPCRINDCVDASPAAIDHQHSPQKVQPIYQIRPLSGHSPHHRLRPLQQSSPFAEFSSFPQSPYLFQQKLKKVCTSFLRSASWSQQPLHKLVLPCSRFTCHGSSVDESEEEKKVTSYDRFFFDTTCHKDFNHSASMDFRKPTWPSSGHKSERQFPTLPIFDKSQREEEFATSRDALRFLAMEDCEAESTANSSPWQPNLLHERQGSGLFSWPSANSIMSLHETDDDDDEGFHAFFSPKSSLQAVSQRIKDANHTETSACSTPLPWFLDFSPNVEENHHVVNKASNKMSLVRLVALIKLKSTISNKVCKLKRRGGGEGALCVQEMPMWSPTLATYFFNNLHKKEALMKLESTPTPHFASEDEQSSPDDGPLRINYHLPTMIKGQLISSHYYLDDDLVSPHKVISLPATSSCPSFNSAHDEGNPKKATHRLSLKEQLAQLNDEYLCPEQTKNHPANDSLKKRENAHACKGMCKLRKTVQVLATSIKLIAAVKLDDGKKGAKRSSLRHRNSLKTIFPLSSPHK